MIYLKFHYIIEMFQGSILFLETKSPCFQDFARDFIIIFKRKAIFLFKFCLNTYTCKEFPFYSYLFPFLINQFY